MFEPSGQVLGENLYQIIQLMTSTVTNSKNFKFHLGDFIQPGAISARGSVFYQALVSY